METGYDMIVAVDFDGTLVEQVNYPCLQYKLKPNAKEVILRLSKKGFIFRLNTARTTWYRLPAILFIWKNKLPVETFLFNQKAIADIYIDDKNIFCKEIDWLKIEKELKERQHVHSNKKN